MQYILSVMSEYYSRVVLIVTIVGSMYRIIKIADYVIEQTKANATAIENIRSSAVDKDDLNTRMDNLSKTCRRDIASVKKRLDEVEKTVKGFPDKYHSKEYMQQTVALIEEKINVIKARV